MNNINVCYIIDKLVPQAVFQACGTNLCCFVPLPVEGVDDAERAVGVHGVARRLHLVPGVLVLVSRAENGADGLHSASDGTLLRLAAVDAEHTQRVAVQRLNVHPKSLAERVIELESVVLHHDVIVLVVVVLRAAVTVRAGRRLVFPSLHVRQALRGVHLLTHIHQLSVV